MKRLYRDILLIVLIPIILAVIGIGLFYKYIPDQYTTNYVESMWDKYNRLCSINEPKIVLIGDSNLAFGINSEYLEQILNEPVVNMGLHGGLGNDVQTRLAMANVNPGDIYVICYTDYGQEDVVSQKDLTLIMLSRHKEMWQELSLEQKWRLISGMPDYMFNSISYYISGRGNEPIEECHADYSYKGFNKYGDNEIRIPENDFFDFTNVESRCGIISDKTITDIRKWKQYCDDRGASLVIAGYPIVKTKIMDSEEMFSEYGEDISKKTDCLIISDFGDYIMDQDYFYDSVFHLTLEGAQHRSEILADDLMVYMDEHR